MADYKKIRIVDQSGTQLEEVNVKDEVARSIRYYYQQPVSAASYAEIMRITDSSITTDTVVLECTFANPGEYYRQYVLDKLCRLCYLFRLLHSGYHRECSIR